MADIADVLAQAENVDNRRTATTSVLLRQDLAREHARLQTELNEALRDDANYNRTPQAPVIAQRIADLEAEIESAKVTFTFRALPRREYVDLISAHPPTKKQLADLATKSSDPLRKPSLEFDPERFPIALIAACSFDPVMSEDDVRRLDKALADEQWSRLWGAAIAANVGDSDPKASRVAGMILRSNERYVTIAAREESDVPTS